MTHSETLEYLKQLHEPWLGQLEAVAIEAIASNDWSPVYDLIADFQVELTVEALKDAIVSRRTNTDSLSSSGVGFVQNTQTIKDFTDHVTRSRINRKTASIDELPQ